MEQITLRIPENTLESIDSEAGEHGKSRSEHIRDILESRTEHDDPGELHDRIADLEAERDELADEVEALKEQLDDREAEIADLQAEAESLEARNTDLTNQLAEANTRIDAANDLVEYAKSERSAQERWREAGLLGKAKYSLFGMPTDDEGDDGE
jgi:chromosome segregation ATPase